MSPFDRLIADRSAFGTPAQHLARLRELVDMATETFNCDGVARFQDALAKHWEGRYPLEVRLIPVVDRGPILVAQTPAASSSSPTAIVLHADIAYTTDQQAESHLADGTKFFGRGALDLKSAIVMVEACLDALLQLGVLAGMSIRIVVNSAEEDSSPATVAALLEAVQGCKQALVCEFGRSNNGIVTSRVSRCIYKLSARSVMVHGAAAGDPRLNPIVALAGLILAAAGLADAAAGITVNFGSQGPSDGPVNSRPGEAWTEFEIRSPSLEVTDALIGRLRQAMAAATLDGISFDLSERSRSAEMPVREASLALARLFQEVAFTCSAFKPALLPTSLGLSDAGLISRTILGGVIDGLGPSGEGQHSLGKEWVHIPDIGMKAVWLAGTLIKCG